MITENLILNNTQIAQKIRRMAYEIYENNFNESDLVLAGIDGTGYLLAKILQAELSQIAPLTISLICVKLDKFAPSQSDVTIDDKQENIIGKTIILVDDVQNSGRTISYSLKPFLSLPIKKLQVGVLVNRGHRTFPVSPDYVGYELSTTINQHITVVLDKQGEWGVYLH